MNALMLIALLAAANEGPGKPARGGELRVTVQADPKTFHPLQVSDEVSDLVRHLTHGSLVRLNRVTQRLEPDLAESWKWSAPGKTLVFKLRKGVRYSDGTPLTSADVGHTMRLIQDPALKSTLQDSFRGVTVTTPDPLTAILTFAAVAPGAERLFDGMAILSARSAQKEKAGLGAFQVAEYKAGSMLRLERNPNYWRAGQPYLDAIRLDVQRNREFELLRFQRGEIHLMANLDAEQFDRVKSANAAQARDLGMGLDNEMLWFNQAPHAPIPAAKKAWFADPAFRKAVSLAVNRADLARLVYKGSARAASGAISPANQFWADASAKAPRHDPEAARKLLSARGYKPGEIEFSIITNAGNKARERMAALIQQDLAKIGIRVTVAPLEFPSLIERILKTANYDACLLGQVISDLDPLGQNNVWVSSGNLHAWNPLQKAPATAWEAEIDKQMETVAGAADPRRRKAAFDRVQRILAEQEPALYLVFKHGLAAASPKVGNLRPSILRPQLLWNAEELYLKP